MSFFPYSVFQEIFFIKRHRQIAFFSVYKYAAVCKAERQRGEVSLRNFIILLTIFVVTNRIYNV